ncbi:MAG: hypothetical protein V4850_32445 [Myxococcota bacterium]
MASKFKGRGANFEGRTAPKGTSGGWVRAGSEVANARGEIRVRAFVGGAPVGQETEPLIVRSTFLNPAREGAFLWGPNCRWTPATP